MERGGTSDDLLDDVAFRRRRQETLVAWKQFVEGDDEAAIYVIPPPVLRSWYRCRDTHNINPVAPSGPVHGKGGDAAARHARVHALLGDLARGIVEGVGNCLATVTDSEAHIRICVTAPELRRQAAESHLEPDVLWPESHYGTNGMGTALLQSEPVLVRGPEHWRQDMHEWTCLGIAVHDPTTGLPVGSLNISSHSETRVVDLATKLEPAVDPVRRHLARTAFVDAMAVAERFSREAAEKTGSLLGLDVVGNIIAASEDVLKKIRYVPSGYLLDPTSRRGRSCAPLRRIAAVSARSAAADPTWTGSAIIGHPLGEREVYSIDPVYGEAGIAGWILTGRGSTVVPDAVDVPLVVEDPADKPRRIAALSGDSVLLLDPREIRFAEASRHVVWLMTDCGRVKAAAKGMANVERELVRYGFIRVHRSFLINPERVRRVHHKGHGLIALSTDEDRPEAIPVSRRSTELVRRRLGL